MSKPQVLKPEEIPSAVLRRLVKEVEREKTEPACYNRIHNRHNRGR